MKKLFVLVVLACLLNACSEQQQTEKMSEDLATKDLFQIPDVLIGATLSGVPLPDNTIVRQIDASTVQLQLPKKVFIYTKDDNGVLYSSNAVCYICTCVGGSNGCDVLYYGGSFGCTECKGGTCSGRRSDCNNTQRSSISDGEFIFIDFSQGVQFINKGRNTDRLYDATDLFFEIPEVQQAISELNKKYYGKTDLNDHDIENTQMVGLNVYGVLVGYPLPAQQVQNFVTVSCKCLSGDSGCVYSKELGGVHRCKGKGCTSCQMRVENPKE